MTSSGGHVNIKLPYEFVELFPRVLEEDWSPHIYLLNEPIAEEVSFQN